MSLSAPPDFVDPVPNLLVRCRAALEDVDRFVIEIRFSLAAHLAPSGRINSEQFDREQRAAHGLAWIATYVEGLRQGLGWAERLQAADQFDAIAQLTLLLVFGEYLNQIAGGIPISQTEIIRPMDLGIAQDVIELLESPAITFLRRTGCRPEIRARLANLLVEGLATEEFGALGLDDETLHIIRNQFRRFSLEQVIPYAHDWHHKDCLIPVSVLESLAAMGVFGLTVPEEYGGLGMGKIAMCVVSEELSRAYIGVGSLGTRSEIAAELIRIGGTSEQKQTWLPRIATGSVLPTAVFTEPGVGSDLGALKTRAVLDGDSYRITGAKTWITHAARSDLMTLLVRTDPNVSDWRGLSILLAEKPRGTENEPFPISGLMGSEIKALGYRGMKEYELAFDDFRVPAAHLLGGVEGKGFKQLMATFESARIQTAARAVGVAQNALELGLLYARDRISFGKPIIAFPRVADKLALMAAETMIARQLTYAAAQAKDSDRRCDIEAGMAKLLAARIAWSNADCALQIHGGNGYAQEYPISRVLCDARILNIFEGAAEIQAQVIARGLLSGRN